MKPPDRVIVTGGLGFIGSALVRRLRVAGVDVLNLDAETYAAVPGALDALSGDNGYEMISGRIEDTPLVRSLLDRFKPDAVVHLAAETHVDRSIDAPDTFVVTNVVGTASLLNAAADYAGNRPEPFRFVHVSTDEVFGSVTDRAFTTDSPYQPNSPYAATKAASDHLARAWHRTYGLETIVTNSSNNYGPWQFPEKLIPRMITRALTGRSMPVYGDGLHERDWIHVDDHVEGLITTLTHGTAGTTYLFGSGVSTTNLQIVRTIADVLDRRLGGSHHDLIEHVQDRPGHDRRYVIDSTETQEHLGWRASRSLEDGLRSTIEWYMEHQAWWERILASRYDTGRIGLR